MDIEICNAMVASANQAGFFQGLAIGLVITVLDPLLFSVINNLFEKRPQMGTAEIWDKITRDLVDDE